VDYFGLMLLSKNTVKNNITLQGNQ